MAPVCGSLSVSRIDLVRIMATPVEPPDVFISHIGHHGRKFRIFTEKMFPDKGAVFALEGLVFTIQSFFHPLFQQSLGIPCQKFVPVRAPDQFDDIPSCAPEGAFQFLNDFPVAPNRPIEPLQITVDDKHQVV